MLQGLTGWGFVIFFYALTLAIVAGVLYLTIRLAVLHALKAHTRWQAQQAGAQGPAGATGPAGSRGPDPLPET